MPLQSQIIKMTSSFSTLKLLFFDKVSQSLINILPFITALIFLDTDYQSYYTLLTTLFLFVSLGSAGLERVISNKNIDIKKALKHIFFLRLISAFIYFTFSPLFFETTLFLRVISTLIILFYYSNFLEYFYIGSHYYKPLISIKLTIISLGFLLRYFNRSIDDYIVLLLFESIIISVFILLKIYLKTTDNTNDFKINLGIKDITYSLLLVFTAFSVNKLYLYYIPNNFSVDVLKILHYFDYLIVFSSIIGNVIIKLSLEINFTKFIRAFVLIFLVSFFSSLFFFEDITIIYVLVKVISACNVLILYLMINKFMLKSAFSANIFSLIIMTSFVLFSIWFNSNIFYWMFFAELSVLISFSFYYKKSFK